MVSGTLYVGQGVQIILNGRGLIGDVVDHVGAGIGDVKTVGNAALIDTGQDRILEIIVAIEIEIDSIGTGMINGLVPLDGDLSARLGDVHFVCGAQAIGKPARPCLLLGSIAWLV